jgi:hypothetical protein
MTATVYGKQALVVPLQIILIKWYLQTQESVHVPARNTVTIIKLQHRDQMPTGWIIGRIVCGNYSYR